MKRLLLSLTAFSFLWLQLISCSKDVSNDSLQNAEPSLAPKAPIPIPTCYIIDISSWATGDTINAKFSYNSNGTPHRVTHNMPSTGRPQLEFRYDGQNRLTNMLGLYDFDPNGSYEFWYQYLYDNNNRVFQDTCYIFGSMVNNVPQPNPFYQNFGVYEYDSQDRITKITRTWMQNGNIIFVDVQNFTYDIQGNLIGGGTYDNMMNIHLTNKVWRLIDQNYSLNNPAQAVSYNQYGYPLGFNTNGYIPFLPHSILDLSKSKITYKCTKK